MRAHNAKVTVGLKTPPGSPDPDQQLHFGNRTLAHSFPKKMLLLEQDIPEFVRSSPYLQSLLSEGPWPGEGLEIPDDCAKKDLSVQNDDDLLKLLKTLRFWLLPEAAEQSMDLLRYPFHPAGPRGFVSIAQEFRDDIPFVGTLSDIFLGDADQKVLLATKHGNLQFLKMLFEEFRINDYMWGTQEAGMAAAEHGHLECLKYLRTRRLQLTVNVYLTACVHAQLECLKYLTEEKNSWVDEAARYCARTGNFEVIKYAMDHYPYDLSEEAPTVFNQVAEAGHLECLKRMYAVPEWVTPDSAQAVKGHLPIIEFAMTQPQRKNLMVIMAVAAEYGHLHIVEYLYKQGCELHEVHIECAALGGHLHIIQYLHELDCPSSPSVAALLAKGNHLEVLQYVHMLDYPWDEDACQRAATAGSIECLTYLHQQGCAWRDITDPESAEWLQFTHETLPEGEEFKLLIPEPEVITVSAACAPTSACLEYVVSHGATLVPSCGTVMLNSRSVSSLLYLHAHGRVG